MNIGERATILTQNRHYDEVMEGAAAVLREILPLNADEAVAGESVAWILAASMLRSRINGALGPRVHKVIIDDGVDLSDRIG